MKRTLSFFILIFVSLSPLNVNAVSMRHKLNEKYNSMPEVFVDVIKKHQNFNALNFLYEKGVIEGYLDGTFKPDGFINRAELMKIVMSIIHPEIAEMTDDDFSTFNNCFPDVNDEWFAYFVCRAKEEGIIEGYKNGFFMPANYVNRVEAIKIILSALIAERLWPSPTEEEQSLLLPSDGGLGTWYSGYLRFAVAKDFLDFQHVNFNDKFHYGVGDFMTRKEVVEMIYRVWLYMIERMEYADILVQIACVSVENLDVEVSEISSTIQESLFAPLGYEVSDIDDLILKYKDDDVLDELISDRVKVECDSDSSVVLSEWDGFNLFGSFDLVSGQK